jgi:carboxypeptidase PM20D1
VLTLLQAILILVGLLLLAAALALTRALLFQPPVVTPGARPWQPYPPDPEVLERLGAALAIPTVCGPRFEDSDTAPFEAFIAFLEKAYPLFHRVCACERVNGYALVYRWKAGTVPDAPEATGEAAGNLLPILLTAHYDVVPAEGPWKHPPFSGAVADGRVWGRGALDIKGHMLAHLEAAEELMRGGFIPGRDYYFVYGQDEEIHGRAGASAVAEHFRQAGLRFEAVWDEGGFIVENALEGVAAPLALIGVTEKPVCNVTLTVAGAGGHASTPPRHTALGDAARLVCALERRPLPPKLTSPTLELLRRAAGQQGFAARLMVANLWLFRPWLFRALGKTPFTNALIRTTCAATMAEAGPAANVLPRQAKVTVNVRLMPGETPEGVAGHFKKLAGKIPLAVDLDTTGEAPGISSITSPVYTRMAALTALLYPNALVTPFLLPVATDSRKYCGLAQDVYRFTPIQITQAEKATLHNRDESISVENYARMIRFFKLFMEADQHEAQKKEAEV